MTTQEQQLIEAIQGAEAARHAAKVAQYQVVNANGALLKTFGADYRAAKAWAQSSEGCGLRYGLRVVKYFIAKRS